MRRLMEFCVYCGRMGSLEGRFVVDDEGFAKLESLYGKTIYFGEVLGKHSEVEIELERQHVKVLTDNQAFLDLASDLGIDLNSGMNPISFAEDMEEAEDDDEQDV